MKNRSGLVVSSLAQAAVRILGSLCALVLTWLIARRSVDGLGVFRTLFVYFLICEFVPLLGMQTFLFREIALHRDQIKKYGFHALVFSGGVAVLAAAALCILAAYGNYSVGIRHGLWLVAAALPATAANLVGIAILVGTGQATTFSLIQGGETLVRTLVGIGFVLLGWGVMPVIAAMVVARWLVLIAYWHAVKPLLESSKAHFDGQFFKEFLGHVPTFAGITVLAMVLRFAAQILLPWQLGDTAAGQFAAAYIFIDLALLVPTALTTNLVPVLARKAQESPAALLEACRQGIKVMALGIMPVAAILAAVARPMFAGVFPHNPSYGVSSAVLEVLIWTCCLLAIDQVLSSAIIARGKQTIDLKTLAIGAGSLVVLLLILIPWAGVLGAAYGVLGGLAVLLVTRFILVGAQIGWLDPLQLLWRPAVSVLIAIVAAMFMARVHWLAGAAAGGVAYLLCLLGLGAFAQPEREGVLRLLQTGKA